MALGAKVSPIPIPAITSGARKDAYDDPASVTTANHTSDPAWRTRPTSSRARSPVRGREHPGERRDDHRRRRPRQRPQARLERRVALDDLEVLGEQEHRAEHADREGQADHVRDREAARAEQPQGQHRVLAGPGDGRRTTGPAGRRRPAATSTPAEVQPSSLPCTMPQMPRKTAAAEHQRAAQVEALPGGRTTRGRRTSSSGAATTPTGTLSQKIACQLTPSTTAPPMTGPSATPRPDDAAPDADRRGAAAARARPRPAGSARAA